MSLTGNRIKKSDLSRDSEAWMPDDATIAMMLKRYG
jgi:hypothetical protein